VKLLHCRGFIIHFIDALSADFFENGFLRVALTPKETGFSVSSSSVIIRRASSPRRVSLPTGRTGVPPKRCTRDRDLLGSRHAAQPQQTHSPTTQCHSNKALFSSQKFSFLATVALLFLFDKHCPNKEYLGSKDLSHKL